MKATRSEMQRWLMYRGADGHQFSVNELLNMSVDELRKHFKASNGKRKLKLKNIEFSAKSLKQ